MNKRARPLPGDPTYGCYNADGSLKRAYSNKRQAKDVLLKGQALYPCFQHNGGDLCWHVGGRRKRPRGA